MEIFLGSLAVFSGWLIFRLNMISERNKITNSLESFLRTVKDWFESSYPIDLSKAEWFNPNKSVYRVDPSIIPNIINNNLISPELAEQLTYFIQLISRFNQRVELFNDYLFSDVDLYRKSFYFHEKNFKNKDYEECNKNLEKFELNIEMELNEEKKHMNKKLAFYIRHYYKFQKFIHTNGIGEMKDINLEGFPQLNKCFHNINCLLKVEKKMKRSILKNDGIYMLGDVIFLVFPGVVLLLIFMSKLPCLVNLFSYLF
jgi:hypothetical protein